ncbi:hypothetical protein FHX64_002041 [Microbacter margulisiae]|uniref:Uncharacterized protein n=1 Tax=Microbacter margulisiae TaxID=1350067 RepID=A0A7W5DTA4_9PORP|nr:hypothetical protein [Microbacter margulisiae]
MLQTSKVLKTFEVSLRQNFHNRLTLDFRPVAFTLSTVVPFGFRLLFSIFYFEAT